MISFSALCPVTDQWYPTQWDMRPVQLSESQDLMCDFVTRINVERQKAEKIETACNDSVSDEYLPNPAKKRTILKRDAKGMTRKGAMQKLTCAICNERKITQWHKVPNQPDLYRCERCYRKALYESQSGVCETCFTTESKRWRRYQNDRAKQQCEICYRRALRHQRRTAQVTSDSD